MSDIVIDRGWGELTFSEDPCFVSSDFEKEIFSLAGTIIKRDDTIFDIGAHQGSYATFFGWLAKEGRVYAFEPHPLNYEYLLKNTSRFPNVRAIQKAVGDKDGKATLMAWDASVKGTTGRHSFSEMGGTIPIEVDVVTIDTFVNENKISHVDFIKMDVEMWEWEVLHGAVATIRKHRPKMIIEIHGSDWANKDTNRSIPRIRDYLKDLGSACRLVPGSIVADLEMIVLPYKCEKCGHETRLGFTPKTLHTGVYMAVNC